MGESSGHVREITVVALPTAPHQTATADALTSGFERHGITVTRTWHGDLVRTPVVVCWGWNQGKTHRAAGRTVLVMERAYLGNRFEWVSLGWNGLNGRATFPDIDDGGDRFRQHFGELHDQDGEGEYALIAGQVPGDASLRGRDLDAWYADQAGHAAEVYDLPVKFRPHPIAVERKLSKPVPGTQISTDTLADDLARAAVVITYNSNTAVDAVLAGCRTVAADEGSMAYPVTDHCIGAYGTHDRETWAHRMAWKQWLPAEIADGSALEHVLRAMP